jgi:predicted ATPase
MCNNFSRVFLSYFYHIADRLQSYWEDRRQYNAEIFLSRMESLSPAVVFIIMLFTSKQVMTQAIYAFSEKTSPEFIC